MAENNEKNKEKTKNLENDASNSKVEELDVETKLKETEDKLLRSLAEIENQRRRFEKEIKDAFEFGSFNFAKESLAILDNLTRAKEAIKKSSLNGLDFIHSIVSFKIVEKSLIFTPSESLLEKSNPVGSTAFPLKGSGIFISGINF